MNSVSSAHSYQIRHYPLKRIFDITFSVFCLLLGVPIFLTIALAVWLTSPGKIIYSHERIGRGGKSFQCYKFRTMYQDADKRLKDILNKDSHLKKEWDNCFKLKNDPRITSIGIFLRKTSLDELPQFWNVLKGDLSVVGPRPIVQAEVDKYLGLKAYKILSIRPGLTGPWQVSGRSDINCYQKRILLDEYYVDHRSMVLDLKLIAKTIPTMLFSKGAY
ncbi:sugar transferase [Candidatus Protochlamydia sp. W-9]|uniref:sugar transferase n=1 Tax=Candidatus Protochlamydia sp. W-9 TaxID=1785087 RepID=UPI00096A56F2|nr:sugar transferase [Candidatus Protochlamydia sp. W-9]